ncbi:MAG: tyrosine--tRNA ligase [Euryarchaeota archaeon]|nr:tyrosine--tRNA ligase [Euryarchaeota archaeon]
MDPASILGLLRRNTAEIVTEPEAEKLSADLAARAVRKAYIGFEPSGRVHLGWKITADKVTDLVDAGLQVKVLLADWHAQINDKLGGDLQKIKACGEYMKHCFAALGVPTDRVEFLYASDYVDDPSYWALVIGTAKATSLARMKRAMDILGRSAEEAERDMSKFIYPAMQVADIFHFDLDLAYGGLDQRHAHMLARDVAHKLGKKVPLAIHTPLLPSLQAQGRMDPIEAKMSKSNPQSGILIHDDAKAVEQKINSAVCPQGSAEGNPVLDLARLVVFAGHLERDPAEAFVVDRPEKFGGPATFATYAHLEAAFVGGKLHPADLKKGVAKYTNEVLEPVREYFRRHPGPLATMQEIAATR